MPGLALTFPHQGCFDASAASDLSGVLNANFASLTGTAVNATVPFGNYTTAGTSVTVLPAGQPAGTYRISLFAVITTSFATSTAIQHVLGWTDDQGAHTQTNALSALTAGTFQTVSTMVRSTGTAAITVLEQATVANATAGAMALSVVVERLL